MEFTVRGGDPLKQRSGCAIVGIFEEDPPAGITARFDKAAGGLISAAWNDGDLRGKLGDVSLLRPGKKLACTRLLVVGCGKAAEFSPTQFRRAVGAAVRALAVIGAKDAISFLSSESVDGADPKRLARITVEAAGEAIYRYDETRTKVEPLPALKRLAVFAAAGQRRASVTRGVTEGAAISAGVTLARHLGNLPANVCTPSHLARVARDMAKGERSVKAKVLNEAEMRKLRMNALLSVTNGTREPAKLIVLEYRGAAASRRPIVLVGKGVTFDAGGISLKPSPHMEDMKYDMGGAAALLGVMKATIALKLKLNLVVIVPACENLPDGQATKPGDVVRTMSGLTVEIINTDAEGRLILCDALTYAQRYKPRAIVDVATLTGACVIALGEHMSALMSNDDDVADALLAAGRTALDPAWRMPINADYQRALESRYADMMNVGGRPAGAITAACFLSRFAEGQRWAHLDVAGTAWTSKERAGGTGRPVGLLVQYLLDDKGR